MAYERLNLSNGTAFDETHVKHLEDGIEEANKAVSPEKTNFMYEQSTEETTVTKEVEQANAIDADVITSNYKSGVYLASTGKWYPLSGWFSTNLIPVGAERPVSIYLYGFASGSEPHLTVYTEDATEETPSEGVVGNNNLNVNYGFTFSMDSFTSDSGYITCEVTTDSKGTSCHVLTFLPGWASDLRYIRLGLKDANITAGTAQYDTLFACIGERYQTVETTTGGNDRPLYRFNKPISGMDIEAMGEQWNGAKWLAIGTSLTSTAQGKWADPMVELSGLDLTNRAVPGAVMGGHILYYAQNATELPTAELITIEGAVNDYAGAKPLGEVGDTVPYAHSFTSPEWHNGGNDDEGTFAGACYQVFQSVRENAPNAVVVVITDPVGQNIYSTGAYYSRESRNSLGLSQMDYNRMIKDVAEYVGIPCIDVATLSNITQETPDYYVDHLHHTELGGRQFANTVWSRLRFMPNKLVSE